MIRFGPRRSHPLIIFHNFFKNFGLLLALLAFSFITGDFSRLLDNLALPIIVLTMPVIRLLGFLFTLYTIDDEKLYIEKGFLNRQKIELPLSTISSVDFTQSLIFQITGVYMVNVENAASLGSNEAKVQFALRSASALEVKGLLMKQESSQNAPAGETADEEPPNERILSRRAASGWEIIVLGLLQAKGLFIFQMLSVAAVIISFGSQLFFNERVDGEDVIMNWFQEIQGWLLLVMVVAGLYLVGFIISTILTSLKYFGFAVTNREDAIFVEYGLLTRKTHTIMKEKIGGVCYKQSFLMRRFGVGTLEVYVAGFALEDDNTPRDTMLFPLLPAKELAAFLPAHVPGAFLPSSYEKPKKGSLPYFFICPRLILSLFFLVVTMIPLFLDLASYGISFPLFGSLWMLGAFAVLFAACSVLLEKRHTGVTGNGDQISLTTGGFTKLQLFLPTEMVEAVKEHASLRKKNKDITNVLVNIMAAPQHAAHKARNVSLKSFRALASCLRY